MSYYDILGGTRNATPSEIREAYLNLIQQYHPDRNRAPDAHHKTLALNEAYSVLSNPSSRKNYDELIAPTTKTDWKQAATKPTASEIPVIACMSCARTVPDLLFSEFLQVISLVFVTRRKQVSGIWCDRCRMKEAFKRTGISLLLGWWGIPWGPIWTAGAIIENSLTSIQEKERNAQLLRALGYQLFMQGRHIESGQALSASLKRQFDQPTSDFLEVVSKMIPCRVAEPPRWRRWLVALPAASVAIFALLLVFAGSQASSSATFGPPAVVSSASRSNNPVNYTNSSEDWPPPHRLANGAEIRRRLRTSGYGELTVENGTAGDAVVVVVDVGTNRVIRCFYVVSGKSFTERNIRAGTYSILFTTGYDWNAKLRKFNRDAVQQRFGKDLEFTESEQRQANGVMHYYHSEDISLQPVIGGTVLNSPIDEAAFESLMNQPEAPSLQ